MNDKPGRNYREWLRQKAWPFPKRAREREGGDSIMPHLQEFLDQAKLWGKQEDEEKDKESKVERDKPWH
jgi:hypothetical protein